MHVGHERVPVGAGKRVVSHLSCLSITLTTTTAYVVSRTHTTAIVAGNAPPRAHHVTASQAATTAQHPTTIHPAITTPASRRSIHRWPGRVGPTVPHRRGSRRTG